MKNHTVQTLRKAGHKVRVTHYRLGAVDLYGTVRFNQVMLAPADTLRSLDAVFLPNGGQTKVEITFANGSEAGALVEFAPEQNYNKKVGVAAALEDALTMAGFSVEIPAETYPILKRFEGEGVSAVVYFTAPNTGVILQASNNNPLYREFFKTGTISNRFNEKQWTPLKDSEAMIVQNDGSLQPL